MNPIQTENVSRQSPVSETPPMPSSPFAVSSSMQATTRLTADAPEWTPPIPGAPDKENAPRSLSTTGVFISLSEENNNSPYSTSPQYVTSRVPSAPLSGYSGSKEPDVMHIASLLNNLHASSADAMFQNATSGLMMDDMVGGGAGFGGSGYGGDQAETLAAKLISQLQDNAISNPALLLQHLLGFAPEDYNDLVTALSESGCNYIEIVAAYLHNIKVQAQENGGGSSSSPGVAAAARQVVVNKYDYLINELNRFKSMKDPATNLLSVARMAQDHSQLGAMFASSPPMFDGGLGSPFPPPPFRATPVDSPLSHSPRFGHSPFAGSPRLGPALMQQQPPFFMDTAMLRQPYAPASPPPNVSGIMPPSLPSSTLPISTHQLFVSQQ